MRGLLFALCLFASPAWANEWHVLEGSGANNYSAVVHVAMPTGNNQVGTSWKICYLATFQGATPKSQLMVGNGAGQISQTESNAIANGDLMEFQFTFTDDPSLSTQARTDNIAAIARATAARELDNLSKRLALYGYSQ